MEVIWKEVDVSSWTVVVVQNDWSIEVEGNYCTEVD
jgi:hypothetical protein